MFSLIKRSGRLACIYTTYAWIMYGGVWRLDRWLAWQLARELGAWGAKLAESVESRTEDLGLLPALDQAGPRCAVWNCNNAPVATSHGWDVCGIHDPRDKALPNGQPATVKGS